MITDQPAARTAIEMLDGYRSGEIEPVAALEECLEHLRTLGTERGIALQVADPETVFVAAVESEQRWRDGAARPLEGIPFGVKDIIATEQLPTTGGASVLGDLVPTDDATCVARLRAAGAVMVAKLATSEFAAGQPNNATFGPVGNPWDLDRWTGGSSTGSGAALASRLLPLAIGTDTGGSVRIPSAWCGTTGIKATYGRVPRTGVLPLSWSLDHVGPMARTARDCGLMLGAMAGPDGIDPTAHGPRGDASLAASALHPPPTADLVGRRIGAVTGWFTDVCDADVLEAWRSALAVFEEAGATVVHIDLPSAHLAFTAGWELLFAEAASLHEVHLDRLGELDPGFVERMLQGRFLLAVDYLRAQRLRTVVLDEALAALTGVDALCTIGVPGTSPRLDDLRVDIDDDCLPMQMVHSRATMFANFTGLPALMAPSGLDRKCMPMAVQLIGRPFEEAALVDIAAAFQKRTSHHCVVPPAIQPTTNNEAAR